MGKTAVKKSNAGRKPLPESDKRKMYSTRLHPKVIEKLKDLKKQKGKPISRILEDLVNLEYKK